MGPPNQQLGDGLCEGFWRCLYPPEFKCVNLLILTVIKGCILTIGKGAFSLYSTCQFFAPGCENSHKNE